MNAGAASVSFFSFYKVGERMQHNGVVIPPHRRQFYMPPARRAYQTPGHVRDT